MTPNKLIPVLPVGTIFTMPTEHYIKRDGTRDVTRLQEFRVDRVLENGSMELKLSAMDGQEWMR